MGRNKTFPLGGLLIIEKAIKFIPTFGETLIFKAIKIYEERGGLYC